MKVCKTKSHWNGQYKIVKLNGSIHHGSPIKCLQEKAISVWESEQTIWENIKKLNKEFGLKFVLPQICSLPKKADGRTSNLQTLTIPMPEY